MIVGGMAITVGGFTGEVLGGAATTTGIGSGGSKIVSRIKESPKLVREAEATGRSVQRSIDNLTAQTFGRPETAQLKSSVSQARPTSSP
jgi:hypothetical protein